MPYILLCAPLSFKVLVTQLLMLCEAVVNDVRVVLTVLLACLGALGVVVLASMILGCPSRFVVACSGNNPLRELLPLRARHCYDTRIYLLT